MVQILEETRLIIWREPPQPVQSRTVLATIMASAPEPDALASCRTRSIGPATASTPSVGTRSPRLSPRNGEQSNVHHHADAPLDEKHLPCSLYAFVPNPYSIFFSKSLAIAGIIDLRRI
jgi:hypothetical protein